MRICRDVRFLDNRDGGREVVRVPRHRLAIHEARTQADFWSGVTRHSQAWRDAEVELGYRERAPADRVQQYMTDLEIDRREVYTEGR